MSQPLDCSALLREVCLVPYQEHIPGPAAELRVVNVFHFSAIAKLITKLIGALRLFVVEMQCRFSCQEIFLEAGIVEIFVRD